ncbi:putative phosphoenolpyruvate synthase [Hypanus sabinus]|uniref:putative phosphoenolpyruvate synthase n=1 Tax=Hypanus sabinus TaxID=79690 RepID=UPI0028C4169D|nr:putative phosphoenolpyruvate synthase [Hypanus sabinus]
MIYLLSIAIAFLCIWIVKLVLQTEQETLNGRYAISSRFYTPKKVLILCLYYYRRFRERNHEDSERQRMGLRSCQKDRVGNVDVLGKCSRSCVEEMECIQEFENDSHAIDSVFFMGFTQTDKTYVVVRICRKPNGLCEMWLLLRVDGIGCFQHPNLPDSICPLDSKDAWSAGGLKLECLEPHRQWRIFFNGLLRKGPYRDTCMEEEGELVHVKMSFVWTSFSTVFNFDTDIHPSAFAQSIAKEKWSLKFMKNLQKLDRKQIHYEQWGQYIGEIEIEGYERKELLLRGVRDHSYGIRNWADLYRYIIIFAHFENGLSVTLMAVSIPVSTTNLKIGFVMFPDGRKAGIDWSDISLADMADDGVIGDLYRFSFTADGQLFNLQLSIDKSAIPVIYGGLMWESRINECAANFRLNLTVRGWGIAEFHYRNESGRQARNSVLSKSFQEPVVPACSKLVQSFSSETCQCTEIVGGKGAQLAQLTEMQKCFGLQFNVPRGFCVTRAALEQQMKMNSSLQQAVAEISDETCGIHRNGNLHELCERCVELFKNTKLAPELEKAIRDQLAELKLLGTEERLAVRSSAIGEDTEDSSAAGQLSTELGLKGFEQVCDGVQKCWASLYSFQAVEYRRQRGQPVCSSMGVIVQQMITAETAGVLFTCHPVTGHPGRMIINANYGLGESVVKGLAEPDTITLSCSPKGQCHILKKEAGAKQKQFRQADEGGVVVENTSVSDASECCLTEDMILRLGQVAFQVQKIYRTPRDIEWAIKDSHIYLLQARPITSFNFVSEFELMHEFDSAMTTDYEWMTTSNIGEMMPGAVTPLTMSTFVRAIEYALQELSVKAGGIPGFSPYNHKFLGICCSHLFFNLMSLNSNMEQNNIITSKKMNDFELLGRVLNELSLHDVALIYGKSPLWKRVINAIKYLQYIVTAGSRVNVLMKKMTTYQIQPASNARDLYFNIDQQLSDYFEVWGTSLSKSNSSGMWNAILVSVLSGGKTEWTSEVLADVAILYSTCSDVVSADIPVAMEGITEAIQTQGKSAEFLKMNAETAISWLLSQESGEAGQMFQNFLQKHGFRCLREAELHEKSWRNDPAKLLPAIRAKLQGTSSVVKKIVLSPEEAIDSLKSNITWIRKIVLRLLLPKARKAVADRELLKAVAIRMHDVFKVAYWKLARLMVQEGHLPDEDLLFFLTHSEIGQILKQRSTSMLTRAQCRRKLLGRQMDLQFTEINIGKPQPMDQCLSEKNGTKITLKGMTVSQGIVKGTAHVVRTIQEAGCIQQGDILITRSTDIGWSPYFPLLRGLVTEIGGLLSHGAVVAREYGIPCIVSCRNATSLLQSGDIVCLNGTKGTVQKIEEN